MQDRQTLSVKGMVCSRCITVLKNTLEEQSLSVEEISLGKVTVSNLRSLKTFTMLENLLLSLDFEVIQKKEKKIVEQIKSIVEKALNNEQETDSKIVFSKLLASELNLSYDTLSAIFSKTERVTLESYIIKKRIDRIKQHLCNTSLTLTEIAYLTGYSSVFHLSRQFKAITGLTPSAYKGNFSAC